MQMKPLIQIFGLHSTLKRMNQVAIKQEKITNNWTFEYVVLVEIMIHSHCFHVN